MNKKVNIIFLIGLVLFTCNKNQDNNSDYLILQKYLNIPQQPYNYSSPNLPFYYSNQFITIQDNSPNANPTTDWGATLGRVLFYDKQLSFNNSISCSSCHIQEFGFTDTLRFSKGFNGGFTQNHSMALANAKFYSNGRFFWDERAASLEDQVLQPITDSIEMGMTIDLLEERLKNSEFYPILFDKAFVNSEINSENIAKALSQFVRSMVSYQSKFDVGRGAVSTIYEDFNNFTIIENDGKRIFTSHHNINCLGCHNTEAFITDNPRNNGLYSINDDIGIAIHTGNVFDEGKFKAPSLKNVAIRYRFMHDGSLSSLDEVINHYNNGIRINVNLDNHLIDANTGEPFKMELTQYEIEALKAFLHTLTDEVFITDVKYSDPFL